MNNKLERLQMVFGCLCLLKKTKDKELRHNLKKKREAPSKRRKLGQYVIISQVHFLNWSLKKVLKKHWFGDFNSAGTRANFDNNCGCWKHNAWDGRVSTLKHANTRCLHEHMPTHVLLAKKKSLKNTGLLYTLVSSPHCTLQLKISHGEQQRCFWAVKEKSAVIVSQRSFCS